MNNSFNFYHPEINSYLEPAKLRPTEYLNYYTSWQTARK